jgi:glycosyltransferase involved in cell wall biosynthesis
MKKKILLLSDDVRSISGVARISKEIIVNTVDRFDWVQLASKLNHEESGKIIDISKSVDDIVGSEGSYVRLYANTGYGDELTLKRIIKTENPDAILHITDPRYWSWLYNIERGIRGNIPICYYHVWDNEPNPLYNEHVYKSCDWIGCISRLTYNVVKSVDDTRKDWQTEYIPHGVCPQTYHPTESQEFKNFKDNIHGESDYKFIMFANNMNIPRKRLPTLISAYQKFGSALPVVEQKNILLFLHTNPLHASGSNLHTIVKDLCPVYDVMFSDGNVSDKYLNFMYNVADVTINIASNEGFGLSTLESMMAGTPIIISKTGGLVDQVLKPDESHGEWASVIEPAVRRLGGNQQTPYIYSDICSETSVAEEMMRWYKTSKKENKKRGLIGREFALASLTNTTMSKKVADGLTTTLENFKPKPRISCEKI